MVIEERRQYPRLILSIDDGFFGHFLLPDKTSLVASIVNLSAGGVNFSISPSKGNQIRIGDVLLLRNIAGATRLGFLEDIRTEIRWIKTLENTMGLVSVGCAFLDLAEPGLSQMLRFVNSERVTRGQYDG